MTETRQTIVNDILRQVGHDLKSPLTAIIGAFEALLALGDRLPFAQRETLYKAGLKEAYRMQHFVQNVMMLTKIEMESLTLEKSEFKLMKSLSSLQDKFSQQHKHAVLSIDPSTDLTLNADQRWLPEAIWQVLDNAGRHNAQTVNVMVKARQIGSVTEIIVQDNGTGIPGQIKNSAFGKYVKGPATAHQDASAGVGLTIARTILQAHNGDAVIAPSDQGTEIILKIA